MSVPTLKQFHLVFVQNGDMARMFLELSGTNL